MIGFQYELCVMEITTVSHYPPSVNLKVEFGGPPHVLVILLKANRPPR